MGKDRGQGMICLNCEHMENMDYIHGCGVCAVLEGETVVLNGVCICPKDIYEGTTAFLKANERNQYDR